MQEIETTQKSEERLRVRGQALLVATLVTAVLLVGTGWAAQIDLASELNRNSIPLDTLAAVYKGLSIVGLLVVGRRLQSRSMNLLALLLVAMAVGSVVISAEWFSTILYGITNRLEVFLPVSSGFLALAIMFLTLAAVAGGLIFSAFMGARPSEKSAVTVLTVLLFAVGIFVGPINAISAIGINREWLFAEDFGQVVSMAFLTGYVAGLVVSSSVAVRRTA